MTQGEQVGSASSDLRAYVPAVLDGWAASGDRHRAIDGTLLFTDLSGFTALNERLSKRGRIGAEVMAGIVTSIFTELLEIAADRGGDMLKFGGDALLLLFKDEGHLRRGALAAAEMQARIRRIGRIDTGDGIVRLRMSAGLHSGRVDLFLVGTSHRDLVCAGPAATATTAMEAVADAGEVLLSPAAAAGLGGGWLGAPKGPGILLGRTPRPTVADERPLVRAALAADEFVPLSVRDHLAEGGHAPEHRLVTVSFVNFQGIDADLEAGRSALVADRLHAAITHAQEVYERYEVSFLATDVGKDGTKIMSATGAPRARAADEDRMLLAAAELVRGDHGLRVHVGVNRGHAFAGDVGPSFRRTYTLLGDTTNTAARVMAKAAPGQVLATPAVLEHATTRFALDVVPPFAAKGKAKPLVAFGIREVLTAPADVGLGAGDAGNDDATGREAERAVVAERWRAAAEGQGNELQVVAGPGLGKSHLVRAALREARRLTAACGPFGRQTAYFTIRLLLLDALGHPDRPIACLAERLRASRPELLPWLPLLGAVFDEPVDPTPVVDELAPEFRRTRLHLLVVELLDLLLVGPAALVVEDAQWVDDASVEALAAIAGGLPHRPWLLCSTRAPEPGGYTAGVTAATVELGPLDDTAIRRLARKAAGAPLRGSVLDEIVRRAGGNPLFAEELARAAAVGGTGVEALPDSVEAVLAVRIDGLPTAAKQLVRFASVFGLRVEEPVLAQVLAELPDAPAIDLRDAEELLERVDGELRFRHALARDAAYEALPFGTRVDLHRRAARAYEARGGPIDLVAIHYARANEPLAAWHHARAAATAAAAKQAHAEAIGFYRMAVDAAPRAGVDPLALADVWEALGDSCEIAGRYEDAAVGYRAARRLDPGRRTLLRKEGELRERAGRYSDALRWYRRAMREAEPDERIRLALAYAGVRLRQGRFDDAVRWAEPALADAEGNDDEVGVAHASYLLHLALTSLGRAERAAYRTRAVPIYERRGDLHPLAKALNNLGVEAYYEGLWNDALEHWRRSREAMARVGDEVGAATLSNNIGEILSDQGRLDEADELFAETAELCDAAGYPLVAAIARKNSGRVASRARRCDDAMRLLDDAARRFEALGSTAYLAETRLLLAECDVFAGRYDEALRRVEDVVLHDRLSPVLEAFALRLVGLATAALGEIGGAVDALERSRTIARSASAEYELAASSLVLGELTGDEGARAEGVDLLTSLGVPVDVVLAAPRPPAALVGAADERRRPPVVTS